MENKKDNWKLNVESLNEDIKKFKDVYPITEDMTNSREGVSRMIMLDRYAYKDVHHETLKVGDMVVATIKPDPNYPTRAIGHVSGLSKTTADIRVLDEYVAQLPMENQDSKTITVPLGVVDKPLEIYYEQIAKRVADGLADVEYDSGNYKYYKNEFYKAISNEEIVPAGRVLYGAGTSSDVTYFNCFVLPYPADSRDGLSLHRSLATEIMSRGGGVGTNGSTLRPKDAIARGVNGKSSGSVSWLNDLANLTHLIEQGGSR